MRPIATAAQTKRVLRRCGIAMVLPRGWLKGGCFSESMIELLGVVNATRGKGMDGVGGMLLLE